MSERKPWSEEEDKALRYLKEVQRIGKWSIISQKMTDEYKMTGRSGKQCRERYHNHLDASIVKTEWTKQQELKLFQMHDSIGNKWAIIAQNIPGRTDNCVKNHFYSKLRKSLRKLNKIIYSYFRKEFKQIKMPTIYKIIQTCQDQHRTDSMMDEQFIQSCQSMFSIMKELKNKFLTFSDRQQAGQFEPNSIVVKDLLKQVNDFNKNFKLTKKASKPGSENFLKVQDALGRCQSSKSSDFNQSDLSGSFFQDSGISEDKSEGARQQSPQKIKIQVKEPEYSRQDMAEQKASDVEKILISAGLYENQGDALPPPMPFLSKAESRPSKMSTYSNQQQNHFFEQSQWQIRLIPYQQVFGHVKKLSTTQE